MTRTPMHNQFGESLWIFGYATLMREGEPIPLDPGAQRARRIKHIPGKSYAFFHFIEDMIRVTGGGSYQCLHCRRTWWYFQRWCK
jgi:hypothetical protein